MKKILFLLTIVIAFASCKKKDNFDAAAQAAADDVAIKAYLAANPSITATKDASGLYYQIITQGSGATPTATSTVTVNYSGKLLNSSTVFDSGTGYKANLGGGVIQGWTVGVPYCKVGGRILLIIPSGMAYGNSSPGAAIPVNSVLVFTIDVLGTN